MPTCVVALPRGTTETGVAAVGNGDRPPGVSAAGRVGEGVGPGPIPPRPLGKGIGLGTTPTEAAAVPGWAGRTVGARVGGGRGGKGTPPPGSEGPRDRGFGRSDRDWGTRLRGPIRADRNAGSPSGC